MQTWRKKRINTLPLLEARASSEIENIVTTADQHRDQARGIAREEFGRELIEAPQLEVVAGPRQPLLCQAEAHLLAAGRVRAVIELDHCRAR